MIQPINFELNFKPITKDSLWLPPYCFNCGKYYHGQSTGGNGICPACDSCNT